MGQNLTPAELIQSVTDGAIKQRPIRHPKLLLLKEIRRLWHSVGKVFYRNKSTLEQWEVGFMRDCNRIRKS